MNPKQAPSSLPLRIGIAGWSYADWKGIVYPIRRERGFSELQWISSLFDCVEINVTFYRELPAKTTARWVEHVTDRPDFTFTAKAHKELTHSKDLDIPVARALCKRTVESMTPLVESGRFGGLLLQFPWYFRDCRASRERLQVLRDSLQELPLVVEVRDRSFFGTEPAGGLHFLQALDLNVAVIDLPGSPSAPPFGAINTGPLGYFRLHGRNSKAWFDPAAGRDAKYDYLYTQGELLDLLPPIEKVASRTEATYVIANNHFRGQAPANALQLLLFLGKRPPIPESLQTEFPFLAPRLDASTEERP